MHKGHSSSLLSRHDASILNDKLLSSRNKMHIIIITAEITLTIVIKVSLNPEPIQSECLRVFM